MISSARPSISAMNTDSVTRLRAGRPPDSAASAPAARLDMYHALQLIMAKYIRNVLMDWFLLVVMGRICLIDL